MNEPVAWMVDGVLFTSLGAALNISFDIKQPCIPLYTHPANPYQSITDTKIEPTVVSYTHSAELTDEEIIACIDEIEPDTADMIRFARAILRKAQNG